MNIKMKTLSLAVLGLAGFAIAGSASAACVAGNLSAWSSTSAIGGTLTVATGGLESAPQTPSECRLDVAVTASFSTGVVSSDSLLSLRSCSCFVEPSDAQAGCFASPSTALLRACSRESTALATA